MHSPRQVTVEWKGMGLWFHASNLNEEVAQRIFPSYIASKGVRQGTAQTMCGRGRRATGIPSIIVAWFNYLKRLINSRDHQRTEKNDKILWDAQHWALSHTPVDFFLWGSQVHRNFASLAFLLGEPQCPSLPSPLIKGHNNNFSPPNFIEVLWGPNGSFFFF